MNVCVYCASSTHVNSQYLAVAETMGQLLLERGHTLVYGGGNVGLMGALARTVRAGGGTVIGVIPEKLKAREGVAYDVADELVVTETMRERKKIMYERADAFAALPGGLGTLEEFMEVLTLKQLGYHARPITLVNTDGFFDPLLSFFEQLERKRFARTQIGALAQVVPDPSHALDHIDQYAPTSPADGAF